MDFLTLYIYLVCCTACIIIFYQSFIIDVIALVKAGTRTGKEPLSHLAVHGVFTIMAVSSLAHIFPGSLS